MQKQTLILQCGHGSTRTLAQHRNAGLEIVYLSRGHLHWQVEGRSEIVSPGSVFFTLPWQQHGSVDEYEPGHHWKFVVIRLDCARLDRPSALRFPQELGLNSAHARLLARALRNAQRHAYPASKLMAQAMPELVQEMDTPGPFHAARIAALTSTILLELVQAIHAANHGSQARTPSAEQRIARFREEIARRPQDPWTLAAMAAWSGLGRSRFADLLKRQTGDTPVQLLHRLRVQRARHLLLQTENSITDIAQACGFSSSQYFAEVFGRFTGQTASSYRRKSS